MKDEMQVQFGNMTTKFGQIEENVDSKLAKALHKIVKSGKQNKKDQVQSDEVYAKQHDEMLD